MDFWKSMGGMVSAELTAAQPERILKKLSDAGVVLYRLERTGELSCKVQLERKAFAKAEDISRKEGAVLRRTGFYGLFKLVSALKRRPVLVMGLVVLSLFFSLLPTRILFIRVEGNSLVPSRQILEAAEKWGLGFFASRREIRSEKLKNALLSEIPQLQWAGVNTAGCVATVSVRERSPEPGREATDGFAEMISQRDGFVLSATATRGTLLVHPGQTVKAGQLLISGYADLGICIRATGAQGEIFAQTNRSFRAVTPQCCLVPGAVTEEKKKISLLLGKKRINLWKDSGISQDSCGRMYEEYYVTLPGGFQLPAALCLEWYQYRQTTVQTIAQDTTRERLEAFAAKQLKQQMIAGQILQTSSWLETKDGRFLFSGNYVCREMIGRLRLEQIGDTNGKDN